MVDVIIPIYRKNPDKDDLISISQGFTVFKDYEITFVHPLSLDISAYQSFENAKFLGFDDLYFKNIEGYNLLMMSSIFYESFHKKYILIYQTDAFVFRNELNYWAQKDFDYIGAPWLRSKEKIPFFKFEFCSVFLFCPTEFKYITRPIKIINNIKYLMFFIYYCKNF